MPLCRQAVPDVLRVGCSAEESCVRSSLAVKLILSPLGVN